MSEENNMSDKAEYRVTLEVDIQADSHEQAAKLIHAYVMDPAKQHIYSVRQRKYYADEPLDRFYGAAVIVDLSNESVKRGPTEVERLLIAEVRKDNDSGRVYAPTSTSILYDMCSALAENGLLFYAPGDRNHCNGFIVTGHPFTAKWLERARNYLPTVKANLGALQAEHDRLSQAIKALETNAVPMDSR